MILEKNDVMNHVTFAMHLFYKLLYSFCWWDSLALSRLSLSGYCSAAGQWNTRDLIPK